MTAIQTLTAAATLHAEGPAHAARVQLTPPSSNERFVDLSACQIASLELSHRSEPVKHLEREAIALHLIRYFDIRSNQTAAQRQFRQVVMTSTSKTNIAFKGTT
ncbi:MAG: hypothetical protein K2X64_04040 [Rhodocyclaceae bacterium]|nr:hypothetical protein [Rhodocyclaceae bacterium]